MTKKATETVGRRVKPSIIAPHTIAPNGLSFLPFSKLTDRDLLALMAHNLRFEPSRRFCREIVTRGLWRKAFARSISTRHIECFIAVIELKPYHNQTALNRECQAIVDAGVIDYLKRQLAEIADALLERTKLSIFQRDPGGWVPNHIGVPAVLLVEKV
jgi:hypothetical protein